MLATQFAHKGKMMTALYQAVVPVMRRGLANLRDFVAKGATHFESAGETGEALLSARLAPDMLSFAEQIQRSCDAATRAVAMLSGMSVPDDAGGDSSVADLLARIDRAIARIDAASQETIDARADLPVVVPVPGMAIHFADGSDYAGSFALPNFFFHSTVAYAILRNRGAPLGKADFLGAAALDLRKTG